MLPRAVIDYLRQEAIAQIEQEQAAATAAAATTETLIDHEEAKHEELRGEIPEVFEGDPS